MTREVMIAMVSLILGFGTLSASEARRSAARDLGRSPSLRSVQEMILRTRIPRLPHADRPGSGPQSFSGEFLLDTSLVSVPAPNSGEYPAAAFDGTNYFVVWENNGLLRGTRVSRAGMVLDSPAVAISNSAACWGKPSVVFNGTDYLVVWQDYGNRSDFDLYAARVSPAGKVLDPDGIAVSTATNDQWSPRVTGDSTGYLVVWEDYRQGWPCVYAARVTSYGEVLDPDGIKVAGTENASAGAPCLGYDGTNYLVAWQGWSESGPNIHCGRVSRSGIALDPISIVLYESANEMYGPAMAFDGTNYLVVWDDYRNGPAAVYGTRVAPNGTVLDPELIEITPDAGWTWIPGADVVFDGSQFVVAWADERMGSRDLYAARVECSGVVRDPGGVYVQTGVGWLDDPCITSAGDNYLVTWMDGCIWGALLDSTLVNLDTLAIGVETITNDQYCPSVAFNGETYFVAWMDYRGREQGYDIYAARVDEDGTVLDPAPFEVCTAPGDQYGPVVGSDGSDFLVVWNDYRETNQADIYAARVSADGTVLDPNGFAFRASPSNEWCPYVAFGGSNYFVTWSDDRIEPGDVDVYGARLSPSGVPIDTEGILIAGAPSMQMMSPVAFDGTNFLVVWSHWVSWYPDIYGARVSTAGAVLDTAWIPISTGDSSEMPSAVAWDGSSYLVVWMDGRNDPYPYSDVYGARVKPSGDVVDLAGIPIGVGAADQMSPSVVFNGTDYTVAWTDCYDWDSCHIDGARISTGVVLDTFRMVVQEGQQTTPTLACGNNGETFLTYAGWALTVGGKTYNAWRIWGMFDIQAGQSEPRLAHSSGPVLEVTPTVFNTKTTLRVSSNPRPLGLATTLLRIYDASGRLVRNLSGDAGAAGNQTLVWHGEDDAGVALPAGIYVVRLEGPGAAASHRVTLVR